MVEITDIQIRAVRQIFDTLDRAYMAAQRYPCGKGDGIIADVIKAQAYNKQLDNAIMIVNEMLMNAGR